MAIEDAAVPVTVVGTDVLAQERKPLPLLEEFALRLTDAGINAKSEIASILGLGEPLVESAIADQVTAGNLLYSAGNRSVSLTAAGRRSVQDLEAVQPVLMKLQIVFDRLTWKITDYSRSNLMTKREVEEMGMQLLPALKTSRISQNEVTAPALNAMLENVSEDRRRTEVLTVRKVRPHTHRFQPVKMLVYGDTDRGEVQVAVVINGDLSSEHETNLLELGGAENLGIHIESPPERPLLTAELEALRIPPERVADLRSATIDSRIEAADLDASSIAEPTPASAAERSLVEMSVRSVSVFEHRELLREALDSAEVRILIISPWVKSTVVNSDLLGRLERRLRAGVQVHIAYGIGSDDRGSDAQALKRLEVLRARYENSFTLARLANTHAKVLIFDDKWIATSFNWLSFRGDPSRTYRMEEGTLVHIPAQVTSEYERYLGSVMK